MSDYTSQSKISLGYVDPSDASAKDVKHLMDHYYPYAYTQNSAFWVQGQIDKRFKVGDQTLWSLIYGDSQYYQSRRFFFNLIRKHINMIVGYQRRNRKSTITKPSYTDNRFDALVDDYNQVLKWSENRDGFQEYLSQAFEGACDVGIYMLHLYMDYTRDVVNGDLRTDSVAYNNFLIDPYFRKQDLSDCNFVWRRRWVSKEEAKNLLPERESEIDRLQPTSYKDGRFPLQAELINLQQSNLLAYDEFHYLSEREATFVHDTKTGEATEWIEHPEDPEDMLEKTLQFQPWLETFKRRVPTVKLAIVVNEKVLYHGQNLLNIDQYPFVPVLCYHEPDIQSYAWRFQGVVRNLRDAQFLYNRRKVIELQILESQINSGWIYPVDVVTDEKAFRQTGQGYLVPLKKGHLPQEVQRIDPPAIPQSMMELSRQLAEDITNISGVNEELLGSATDDKAGILSMLRQGAGLTTLQTIFDKLDYTQRLYGNLRLKAVQRNWTKAKLISVLGREPQPEFYNYDSLKFSVTVEEGDYSATQRHMELQQKLHFRELGMPIPDKSILRSATFADKQQTIQEIEEQQNAEAQQQMQQAQQQDKESNAKIMAQYAKAKSDLAREKEQIASALEKNAKVVELQEEAEHKQTEADLNLVKMMIGLEDMDLENFRRSLELAEVIKQQNVTDQEVNNA